MKRIILLITILFSFGLNAEALSLSCDVIHNEKDTKTSSKRVSGDVNLTINESETIVFNPMKANVKIKFDTDISEGQIIYPPFMLPPINGAKQGTVKIKKIKVSNDSYTLISNYNFMNQVTTIIDRKTGNITSSSTLRDRSYTGTCSKVDETVENKF